MNAEQRLARLHLLAYVIWIQQFVIMLLIVMMAGDQ